MDEIRLDDTILVADEIKKCYEKKKQLTLPYYRTSQAQFPAFMKAAELCKTYQATPAMFVEAQFYWAGLRKMDVWPNMLHGKQSYEAYKEFVNKSYVDPVKLIDVYMSYVENHVIKLKRPLEKVLLDDDISMAPWFRVVASAKPYPSVLEKYKVDAREEMTPEIEKALKAKGFDTTRIWNSPKNS